MEGLADGLREDALMEVDVVGDSIGAPAVANAFLGERGSADRVEARPLLQYIEAPWDVEVVASDLRPTNPPPPCKETVREEVSSCELA
jgi:hypothetical protein